MRYTGIIKGGECIGKVEPKYSQIAREIREAIVGHIYPIGSRLSDGKSLAADYGVGLMTLKRALDLLVAEGYIIRRRGDGSFIRDWKQGAKPHLYSLKGVYENYDRALTSKVLSFEATRPD